MKRETFQLQSLLPSHRDQLEVARLMNETARRERERKAEYEARVASRNGDRIAREIQHPPEPNYPAALVISVGFGMFAAVVLYGSHRLLTWLVGV